MSEHKISEIKALAHSIDMRINLFEGYTPKNTSSCKGELLFWKKIVSLYGLFADCDRVQVKEKKSLVELMKRYQLLSGEEHDRMKLFWDDISEMRKWFCHNNEEVLFFSQIRKNKIEKYLTRAFVLSSNKPDSLEDIQSNDWNILIFNIDSRFDEYLNLLRKALLLWKDSDDKEDLIQEWIEIQSNALFSNKELIQNVLAEKARYDIYNNGINTTTVGKMTMLYSRQLESGGFSQSDIKEKLRQCTDRKRSNREILHECILSTGLI